MHTTFKDLRPGDKVVRMLAGVIPMDMEVMRVDEQLLWCSAVQADGTLTPPDWSFSRNNGAEIDADLGWDEHQTGSYLVMVAPDPQPH